MDKITPCLWFDRNAEEAVAFYLSVFPDARILGTARYPNTGHPAHADRVGEVLAINFQLAGRTYMALNGGPDTPFTPAVSLQVRCETQEEIDHYWQRLTEGGGEPIECGWLRDKFGLSWQIMPAECDEWLTGDPETCQRMMLALMGMQKLDLATLRAAAAGA